MTNKEELQKAERPRIMITSALPYINGVKHLGNLIGSMLPADLYARYCRMVGYETLFICGTDEHGTPAELAAADSGKSVEEFTEEMYSIQSSLYEQFDLSFDWFGRSSCRHNHQLTQYFASRLFDNGLLEKRVSQQVYSLDDNRFLPDRYIEGECPHCGYEKARGDQCERCTMQLNPVDLINARSVISGSSNLEVRDSYHFYLLQSRMSKTLREWLDSRKTFSVMVRSIALKWLNDGDGIQDRGITRDLTWGIKVAKEGISYSGMEEKVFYVWFDAPIAYIAATQEWADHKEEDWKRWWLTDHGADNVKYIQFMAKDNIPFHTISFPITLLGSGEPWKLVDRIIGYNWLTYRGGKFSTSSNRGIFMDQALEVQESDCWRWWLLSNIPESADTDFDWHKFQLGVNGDLANTLGNFVNRVMKFCSTRFDGIVPDGYDMQMDDYARNMILVMEERFVVYTQMMEEISIRKAAQELRAMWSIGNEFLQRLAPWAEYAENPLRAGHAVRVALNLIYFYSIISEPFIPVLAERMRGFLRRQSEEGKVWPRNVNECMNCLKAGEELGDFDVLVHKIKDQFCEEMEHRFG